MGEGELSNGVREVVRERYGQAALRVIEGQVKASCCGTGGSCGSTVPITRDLYDSVTTAALPEGAVLASLGCGNPTALAELKEGEVVLDLGSGGGIDVFLSVRRVGPTWRAYGLDMTDEMLDLARKNAADAGVTNVEFLKGHIEEIPLPDDSVDVIISNCVINLSADKRAVLKEAFRVLKPGGRFAVSDVVINGDVPAAVRNSMELWVGCVAGALEAGEFEDLLRGAGFENPTIEPTRLYDVEDARAFLEEAGLDVESFSNAVEGRFMAAFVRATKPAEEYRGRGLGAALTDTVLRRASAEGITDVYLLTETAAEFFAGCGFQRIARSDAPEDIRTSMEFARLCPTTSTLMTCALAPSS